MNIFIAVLLLGKVTFAEQVSITMEECRDKIENRNNLPSYYFSHMREDHTLVCIRSERKPKIGRELI